MKKYLYILAVTMLIFSCNNYSYLSSEKCYKVYKIKLHNEYYEIYAKQGRCHYKIISKIEDYNTGIKIKRGRCYNFILTSMRESMPTIDGVKIIPMNYLDVQYVHSDNTTIKIDGGKITDLYFAKNLKGLYLIE